MQADTSAPDLVGNNIDQIIRLEERAARHRTWSQALAHAVGRFAATPAFVLFHAVAIGLWVIVNGRQPLPRWVFDPYPFNLLSTILSAEAVMLTAFVLMNQNRTDRIGDRRDHLDLQVNLLTEQEASMTIQMLDRIGRKLGIEPDSNEAALRLSRIATLEHLVKQLHVRLPDYDAHWRADHPEEAGR